jgi:predicted N-acetyltransferase YhbS
VAVPEDCRGRGIGGDLVRRSLSDARRLGYAAVILVGDEPYYSRFGFSGEKTGALWMPGPFERHRLLAVELIPGALDGARGMIAPTGRLEPKFGNLPDLAALVAQDRRASRVRRQPRAA